MGEKDIRQTRVAPKRLAPLSPAHCIPAKRLLLVRTKKLGPQTLPLSPGTPGERVGVRGAMSLEEPCVFRVGCSRPPPQPRPLSPGVPGERGASLATRFGYPTVSSACRAGEKNCLCSFIKDTCFPDDQNKDPGGKRFRGPVFVKCTVFY